MPSYVSSTPIHQKKGEKGKRGRKDKKEQGKEKIRPREQKIGIQM